MKIVETDRLIIRNWEKSDSKDLFEYAKSELVGPNAGWKPHRTIEDSEVIIDMFIKSKDVFALELKEERKVIGSIGIHNRNFENAFKDLNQSHLGFVLNPVYWGNGYMTETVKSIVDYCFSDLELDLLWCGHYDFNEKSKNVIKRCGFSYQFTRNETLTLLGNKKVNTLYYCLENKE